LSGKQHQNHEHASRKYSLRLGFVRGAGEVGSDHAVNGRWWWLSLIFDHAVNGQVEVGGDHGVTERMVAVIMV
jgi:hypothetical protein